MKKFTLVTVLMLVSVIAFAQKPVRFGVYVGGATPMGNLGQGDVIKKTTLHPLGDITTYALMYDDGTQGYASVGANVGFDVTIALPVEGLGVFGGIDIFVNANNSDIRSYFNDWENQIEKEIGVTSAEFNLPNVWNIPILFGLNYLHNFNNIVGIWGEAAIGPNFRLISDYKFETKYTALQSDPITGRTFDTKTVTYDYDAVTTLGFKLGGGVMLWDKMSIGLDFYALGKAKISGKAEEKEGDHSLYKNDFKGKNDFSSSELVVRVGYHF